MSNFNNTIEVSENAFNVCTLRKDKNGMVIYTRNLEGTYVKYINLENIQDQEEKQQAIAILGKMALAPDETMQNE
jgi:hypothetical protein